MNGVRIGKGLRALRHRLGWRQQDVADAVGVSQDLISLLERGRVERTTIGTLERVAARLDAELVVFLRWRGGELDRLLDEGHAALAGVVARRLSRLGWRVLAEVTYSEFGERGSVDLLAWHPESRTLLVVEVKTELVSLEETLRKHDAKVRLAPAIARRELGVTPVAVARLLVLPGTTAARSRVARHESILTSTYPLRGRELRRWLGAPRGRVGGLWFVSLTNDGRGVRRSLARRRIHRERPRPSTGV